MHAADAARQTVARGKAHILHFGGQQHGGGLDQCNGRATRLQAQADHAVVRDHGDDLVAAADVDDHLVVDGTGVDAVDRAGELVACAGFHGHFPHEQIVVRHAGGLAGEQGEKLLVFCLDLAKVVHQLEATLREARAAAALAAAAAFEQGLAGELVHVIDGVPGALVAHADGLGGLGDGAGAGDRFEQRHLAGAAEQLALHGHAELALQVDRGTGGGGLRHAECSAQRVPLRPAGPASAIARPCRAAVRQEAGRGSVPATAPARPADWQTLHLARVHSRRR